MVHKADEFRTMTQGTMKVEEYARHFTKMMRYAPDETRTDEQRQYWFHRGLHRGIRTIVAGSDHKSLRHMINRALAVEKERMNLEDSLKAGKHRTKSHHRPG